MKKQLVKCDKCGVDLDGERATEKNCTYYELTQKHMEGWGSISYDFGRSTTFQICNDCFKLLGIMS